MPSLEDQLRARIAEQDKVRFLYRRKSIEGTVVRTNRSRAVVRVDNEDFHVPYDLLTPITPVTEERIRRIAEIEQLATQLIAKHRLKHWSFQFDHATRRAGCCNYRNKTISLSFDLARSGSEDDIKDTILHEIAHALVGRKHNHDEVWKSKALEIGCTGERTHRLEFSSPKWKVRCENDCWSRTAHRRNRRLICRQCGGKLVYSAC